MKFSWLNNPRKNARFYCGKTADYPVLVYFVQTNNLFSPGIKYSASCFGKMIV